MKTSAEHFGLAVGP